VDTLGEKPLPRQISPRSFHMEANDAAKPENSEPSREGAAPSEPRKAGPDAPKQVKTVRAPLRTGLGSVPWMVLILAASPVAMLLAWRAQEAWVAPFLGRLHVVISAFPFALLLYAALLEGMALVSFGRFRARTRLLVFCAAAGAVAAAASGTLLQETDGGDGVWMKWHLISGWAAAGFAVLAAFFRFARGYAVERLWRGWYRLCLLFACIAVMAATYFGTARVHGDGYLIEYAPWWPWQASGAESEAQAAGHAAEEPPVPLPSAAEAEEEAGASAPSEARPESEVPATEPEEAAAQPEAVEDVRATDDPAVVLQRLRERYPGVIQPADAASGRLRVDASPLGNGFGDADLARFVPIADRIERLDLTGTAVTDASAPVLAAMRHLRTLRLGETAIGDETVAALAGLGELESLSLYKTRVTADSWEILEKIASLKNLYTEETPLEDLPPAP